MVTETTARSRIAMLCDHFASKNQSGIEPADALLSVAKKLAMAH
jgi:hypothetical protein